MSKDMNKFKVGDKVKVVDHKHGHFFTIGSTVTIVSHDALNGDYDCSDGNEAWYLREEEMELAEEQVLENAFDKAAEQFGATVVAKSLIEKETQMNAEQLREEIIRIDARIEEAKKDIENAQTERNSLVDKLREKGFEMVAIHATCGGCAKVTVMNVEIWDKLILTSDSLNGILKENSEVYIDEIDFEEGTTIPFYVKDIDTDLGDWVYLDDVKFKE